MQHGKKLTTYCLITVILLSAVLLNACSKPQHELTGKYQPVLNLHPKYFMTVSGNIKTVLPDKVELKLIADYYTNNKKCEKTYNSFEGVVGARVIRKVYVVKPDKNGIYLVKLPLDKYIPGYCSWDIAAISYILFKNNHEGYVIGSFSSKAYVPKKRDGQALYACNNLECIIKSENPIQRDINNLISSHSNYTYKIDFIRRK